MKNRPNPTPAEIAAFAQRAENVPEPDQDPLPTPSEMSAKSPRVIPEPLDHVPEPVDHVEALGPISTQTAMFWLFQYGDKFFCEVHMPGIDTAYVTDEYRTEKQAITRGFALYERLSRR